MNGLAISRKQLALAITALAFAAGMALVAAAPAQAITTANGAKASSITGITTGATLDGFDVTGDGQGDAVTISMVRSNQEPFDCAGINVLVNGVNAFTNSDACFYANMSVISTKTKGSYIYLDTVCENDYRNFQHLFKYSNGKLVSVLNFQKFYNGKGGTYIGGEILKVDGDAFNIKAHIQSNVMGDVNGVYTFVVASKGLTRTKRTATALYNNGTTENGWLTIAKSFKGYTSTKCTKVKYTYKKGVKVKVLQVFWKSNGLLIKVKTKSGKVAWVKNAKSYNAKTDSGTWFKEMGRAG